jgi:hypothetical protein
MIWRGAVSDDESDRTTTEPNLLLAQSQLEGKNLAIHAYDQMIWKVRSGYLTLVFGGWGILLTALANGVSERRFDELIGRAAPLVGAMFVLTSALAGAGYLVDIDYVRRKFRVIHSLNGLMNAMQSRAGAAGPKRADLSSEVVGPFLQVSGDSGSKDYLFVGGFEGARRVSRIIYPVPVAATLLACILLLFGTAG